MFICTNGMVVDVEMLCDGSNDCGDNSDEEYELCPSELHAYNYVMWPELCKPNIIYLLSCCSLDCQVYALAKFQLDNYAELQPCRVTTAETLIVQQE